MNSPAVLNDIALTKQLSDGTIEWVPLKGAAQQEPASAGVSYTLIDRSRSYEAPQSLRLERRDDDLVVGSEGKELLIITDFFAAEGTSFFPEHRERRGSVLWPSDHARNRNRTRFLRGSITRLVQRLGCK